MGQRQLGVSILRAIGLLLIALGVVHLVATPHIPGLLKGIPSAIYQRAVGPTILNHVLVGVLLLPLGYTTWLAAGGARRREAWARRILITNAVVMLALPLSVVAFMRQPEYYTAPMFLLGVGLVAFITVLMIAATFILMRGGTTPRNR